MYSLTLKDIQSQLIQSGLLREIVHQHHFYYQLLDDQVAQGEFFKISYNSKDVSPDTLFFCKGEAFKEAYLKEAVASGVTTYVSETYYPDVDATGIIVNDIRLVMAELARNFYDQPDTKLQVIGITGTKGKTTTAYLLKNILDNYKPKKTALISTMEVLLDGQTSTPSSLTTPEAMDLYGMMAEAVENKMAFLVMEVSSQAYKTGRVHGLEFDVGAFLNLSPDHISPNEHPNLEDYFHCKAQLMAHSKVSVINSSLDQVAYLIDLAQSAGGQVYTYGPAGEANQFSFQGQEDSPKAFEVIERDPDLSLGLAGDYEIGMLGAFNKENALCAAIASKVVGADLDAIQEGIRTTQVSGRMEHFTYGNNEIYVDFAHNYISLKNLFDFVQAEHPDHEMVVVLGAPGNKGISRRKDMGEVLSLYEGRVILTEDDPNFEEVHDISQQIADHIDGPIQVDFNDDRQETIEELLESLSPDSQKAIVLCAKGSDTYLLIDGKKAPYIGDVGLVENFLKDRA